MKPKSQEFFTEFDPLYRTYDKQAALDDNESFSRSIPGVTDQWEGYNARFKGVGNWAKNVLILLDLALARGRDGESIQRQWAKHRSNRVGYAAASHPFHLLGGCPRISPTPLLIFSSPL